MIKYNPDNERLKHRYYAFLKQAKGRDDATIDGVSMALRRFEEHTKFKDFRTFRPEQAVSFKAHLAKRANATTGKPLSKATQHQTSNALKTFFQWLSAEPGYRSRITYSHADYFNLSEKDVRVATAKRNRPVPSLEQIHHVLRLMPYGTETEKRDRALVAFLLLTGMRDGAVASMRIGLVNLDDACVFQDARLVKTKFAKTFRSWFFPVGGNALDVVTGWIGYLANDKLYGPDDPLFPISKVINGPNLHFIGAGLERRSWTNAGPIRKIVKEAFLKAGFAPFNPHSFRKTLVRLGQQLCKTPEEFKAWSQNLGHEDVMTTFSSYGDLDDHRRRQVLTDIMIEPSKNETQADERKRLIKRLGELG
ncbi:tyrosine-type recombinase/integrase [Aestuariivirga litoralis]|uniref:tyrosine-type recombinase/integrase n=1 Tax=Aestuariivirga litoralis TaxID=2650924 RepID=UPI0018C7CDF5|nr:tyrosine-type recombinase/integrase [Aestuariivirga litoralis]MBG1231811.1 tyrosine-type recombinase/integrase [Aestuariivirga litoralis]